MSVSDIMGGGLKEHFAGAPKANREPYQSSLPGAEVHLPCLSNFFLREPFRPRNPSLVRGYFVAQGLYFTSNWHKVNYELAAGLAFGTPGGLNGTDTMMPPLDKASPPCPAVAVGPCNFGNLDPLSHGFNLAVLVGQIWSVVGC